MCPIQLNDRDIWCAHWDSNPNEQIKSLQCYLYIMGTYGGQDWSRTNSYGFSDRRAHRLRNLSIVEIGMRFELMTYDLEGHYSIQLNYRYIIAQLSSH